MLTCNCQTCPSTMYLSFSGCLISYFQFFFGDWARAGSTEDCGWTDVLTQHTCMCWAHMSHVSFFHSYFLYAPTLLWTWACHCSSDIFVRLAQNSFLNVAVKNFWKPSKRNRPLSRLWNSKSSCREISDAHFYILSRKKTLSDLSHWWLIENANRPSNEWMTCWSLVKMVAAKLNRSPAPKWQKRGSSVRQRTMPRAIFFDQQN